MVTFGPGTIGLLDAGQLAVREAARDVVASGFQPLDALLPAGGVRRGSLIEWLAGGADAAGGAAAAGTGAATLACAVACRLARAAAGSARALVLVDRTGWFHPPAVLPWLGSGQGDVRLVVARPAHDDDEIWTIDQALRCPGVAAVLAWPREGVAAGLGGAVASRRRPTRSWAVAMRRWQLAARAGGAVGLFVRPLAAVGEPSWAEARIAVAPLPGGSLLERRLRLERVGGEWIGGAEGARAVEVAIDLARGCAAVPRGGQAAGGRPAFAERSPACRAS
jgi:protein ImuA